MTNQPKTLITPSTTYIREDIARADADAEVALALEEAAEIAENERRQWDHGYDTSVEGWTRIRAATHIRDAIRALAPSAGLAKLAELRALSSGNGRAALDNLADIVALEAERDALAAEVARLRDRERVLVDHIRWAHDTLWELNPSNYGHDEVCKVNDAAVEVILGLAPIIGETHGHTAEWWADRTALATDAEKAGARC